MDRAAVTVQTAIEQLLTAVDTGYLPGTQADNWMEPDEWAQDQAVHLNFARALEEDGGFRIPVVMWTFDSGMLRPFDLLVEPPRVQDMVEPLSALQDRLNEALAYPLALTPRNIRVAVAVGLLEAMDSAVAPTARGDTMLDAIHDAAQQPQSKPLSLPGAPQDADLPSQADFLRYFGFDVTVDDARVRSWPDILERGLNLNAWLCYLLESEDQVVAYCGPRSHDEAETASGMHVVNEYEGHNVSPTIVMAPDREDALETWHRWSGVPSSETASQALAHQMSARMATAGRRPGTAGQSSGLVAGMADRRPPVAAGRGVRAPGELTMVRGTQGLQLLTPEGDVAAEGTWGEIRRWLLNNPRYTAHYMDLAGTPKAADPHRMRAPELGTGRI